MTHAQNIALALWEVDALSAFVTTLTYRRDSGLARLLGVVPGDRPARIQQQLMRRSITEVPEEYVRSHPGWEIARTLSEKLGASPPTVDRIWDVSSHRFDALVARRYVPHSDSIHCFEYTALQSFKAAAKHGKSRVLHLPALDNVAFRHIQQRERKEWTELASPFDAHFEASFSRQQARRAEEIALADVIICNSSLTAQSHIEAGANPDRTFVVPLAAPPPIETVAEDPSRQSGTLRVIYAGPFSLRKGAHYLLQAWRKLNAGTFARLDVYGTMLLPPRFITEGTDGIVVHGSVPRADLFAAYQAADVLVFPTLSDGFGMVVTEALAHGCPVITTNMAGAADLLTPESGQIVSAADPDAIAVALRWCLDNRRELADMRHHALAVARRRQWSDFRRDLVTALDQGLRRQGINPEFKRPKSSNGND